MTRTIVRLSIIVLVAAVLASLMTGCTALAGPPEDLWMIQKRINERFIPVSDFKKWGKGHYWEQGVTGDNVFSGDCEEYAAAAKVQLERKGHPVTMWRVELPDGEHHAVSCTIDGDWCLDNLRGIPVKRDRLKYQWIAVLKGDE